MGVNLVCVSIVFSAEVSQAAPMGAACFISNRCYLERFLCEKLPNGITLHQ